MAGSRKLGRTSDHRKAMLRGMVTLLLEKGKIVTTVARAKEVRSAAEKMITLGKAGTLHTCLLYTSPSPRDRSVSRMPSSA